MSDADSGALLYNVAYVLLRDDLELRNAICKVIIQHLRTIGRDDLANDLEAAC